MKSFLVFALLLGAVWPAVAQIHPPVGNARYDESNAFVFRDRELATIHVTMSPSDLDTMLANPWNDVEYPCTVRFSNAVTDEIIQNVTIKIRGNTSRNARKKSFRLSFNTIVSGTRFHGIKKLNIIGAQNDVSIFRAKMALDQLRAFGLPSQRTVLTHFTINDGARANDIYVGTEQINDDFLKAWFGNDTGNLYKGSYEGGRADLRYVAPGDAATYQNFGNGQTYVEENNEENPNYTDLADLIRFINHSTSQEFFEGLPARFNVDGFLRTMAADVVLGGWDNIWYGSNNWFMYHNPTVDRFEWIPYDYDNTFGVDFFGVDWARRPLTGWGSGGFGSNPDISPLVRRVLAVPSWEAQLRRYIHEFVGDPPEPPAPAVYTDTAGDTFLGSAEPHFDILRAEVTNNTETIFIAVKVAGPIDAGGTTDQARFVLFFDTGPGGLKTNPWGRDINSTVAADYFLGAWTNGGGGFLGYRPGTSVWAQHASPSVSQGISLNLEDRADGIVRFSIPRSVLGLAPGASFTFDIASTNDRNAIIEPGIDHVSNPAPATSDYGMPSTPGAFLDYTLQTSTTSSTVAPFSLTALSGKIHQLKALASPYAYRGPLSGATMDWGWTPEDFAASFETPVNYQSPGRPWNWGMKAYISTRSAYLRNAVAKAPPQAGVFVNEVLTVNNRVNRDQSGAFDEWIELYNSRNAAVDVGGMYLSDTPLNVRKWRIPDGTTIPGKGFLLVWADNQTFQGTNHASFVLSALGQTIGLYDRDANSNLLINSLQVPPGAPDVSFGRFPDGSKTLLSFTTVTPLAPNTDGRAFTLEDAVRALRMGGGLDSATGGTTLDANRDGLVDALDSALILRKVTGL